MPELDRWDARIARARRLAEQYPAAAEILTFYAHVATFQKSLAADPAGGDAITHIARIAPAVPGFLALLERDAPAPLARAAAEMRAVKALDWHALGEAYWSADAHDLPDADAAMLFVIEALLQPIVESRAGAAGAKKPADAEPAEAKKPADAEPAEAKPGTPPKDARCPSCGGKPVVGVLRESGQSARRSLVCGLCLTEWPWPRIVCPNCGETAFDALHVYHSDAFPAARVDACTACRTWLKTIDLSKDALAIPVVDDLASVPLDLWAGDQGYRKLRPNLLRI